MKFWKKTLTLLMGVLVLGACESYVDKVDEIDPTAATDASAGLMLTAVEVNYIGFLEGDLARLAGMWSGYFTGIDRQYVTLYNYTAVSADFDAAWSNIFTGVVKNTRIIRQKSTAAGNRSQLGVAKIIEAHTLGMTAALFGDIPNQQAGDVTQFPNPQFESQTAVYASVQTLLTEAVADLNANVGSISGDFLYGGDPAAWIAAANTLRAKFFLHQGQYAQAVTAAQSGIRTPAGSLYAPHGSSYLQNFNVYYSFLNYDRPGYMTADGAFLTRLMNPQDRLYRGNAKTNEEGRFNYYYQSIYSEIDPNSIWADDFGTPTELDGFYAATRPFPLITFEENQLTLAESQARLGQTAAAITALNSVRAFYNTGGNLNTGYVDFGVEYAPYVLADFQSGGVENVAGGRTADQALLREILEERYVSLYGQLEAFNDIRRTNNALGIPPNTGNQIPRRFLVAQAEINANRSVPATVPDLFTPTAIFR